MSICSGKQCQLPSPSRGERGAEYGQESGVCRGRREGDVVADIPGDLGRAATEVWAWLRPCPHHWR